MDILLILVVFGQIKLLDGNPHRWMLRSTHYYEYDYYYSGQTNYDPGYVDEWNGAISSISVYRLSFMGELIAPAMNVDVNSILLSSVVSGLYSEVDAEYKLTLLSDEIVATIPDTQNVIAHGNTVTLPYSIGGGHQDNVTQLSIIILDREYSVGNSNDARVLFYNLLTENCLSSGTASFRLPTNLDISGWGTNYYVYMIAEDINGQYETDYASDPVYVRLDEALPPVQYSINVTSNGNGGTTVSSASAIEGTEIYISATPNDGFQFVDWQVLSGEVSISSNRFTVGTSDVEIRAIFEPIPVETGVSGFVERLYTVALGRASDPQGKQNWIDAITLRGETGASAARGFLYSPEFLNRQSTNDEFVTVLYRTFFDRAPDQAGFDAWVSVLNNGTSKEEVIEGFINSTEWANLCLRYGIKSGGTGTPNIEVEPNEQTIQFATRLYTTCLNRAADQNGLMAWARQLANRRNTGVQAASGFFFGTEFTNQHVNNGEYVNRLYRTFMGREADSAGYNAWVRQLNSGTSREEVFNGFAMSNEFGNICASYGIERGEPIPTPTPTPTPTPVPTATPTPAPPPASVPSSSSTSSTTTTSSNMVIITATGNRYHCRVHGNMSNYWSVPVSEARGRGLTPCGVCYH